MNGVPLAVGLQWSAMRIAALVAGSLFAAAACITWFGLAWGAAPPLLAAGLWASTWQQAALDGLHLVRRGPDTLLRTQRTPAIRLVAYRYRRRPGPPRLALRRERHGLALLAVGPSPRLDVFRQLALWVIVHADRRVQLDPVFVDALAAEDPPRATDQASDTRPA